MDINDQLDEGAADFRSLDPAEAKQAVSQPAATQHVTNAGKTLSSGAVVAIIAAAAVVLGIVCYAIFFRKPAAKPAYRVSCSPEQPYCNQSAPTPRQK